MPYLLGTDEAGYGPNLGPLVISASLWEVPEGVRGDGLYERLPTAMRRRATRAAKTDQRVVIADSKTLYQSGKGLKLLERGLWAAWGLIDRRPAVCGDVSRTSGLRRHARCEALRRLGPAARAAQTSMRRKSIGCVPHCAKRLPRRVCGWSICKCFTTSTPSSIIWPS